MITDYIPQRKPFLFVDDQFEVLDKEIKTTYNFSSDHDFFKGHFPGDPIVPGVILSEHCFQSAAALMGHRSGEGIKSLAVVSRIQSAKFKNIVRANQVVNTTTTLTEELGAAAYFKSVVTNEENKKVLIIEFACTLVSESAEG